jgi:hypothetical protein
MYRVLGIILAILIALAAIGLVAHASDEDRLPFTPEETAKVERHLSRMENAKLSLEKARLAVELAEARLEIVDNDGLKLMSQIYRAHGFSQKTHDFVAGQANQDGTVFRGFVVKKPKLVPPEDAEKK